jgi:two-component system, OmpR family, response regulator
MTEPKRSLVVEDDSHIAELLKLHLRDEGYEVEHTGHGDLGLRLLQTQRWSSCSTSCCRASMDSRSAGARA